MFSLNTGVSLEFLIGETRDEKERDKQRERERGARIRRKDS